MNDRNADTDHEYDVLDIHPYVITGATMLGLLIALVVGAASFVQSFTTLVDMGILAGIKTHTWVTPIILDGPILACGVIRVALSQHTDRKTVRGRRFVVVGTLIVTGLISMAGNAYHTVITGGGALPTAVSALAGTLAPAMVMVMSEVVSVILSAPRHRRSTTSQIDGADQHAETTDVREGRAHTHALGGLDEKVWEAVHLYHNDPDVRGNFSKIASRLGKSTSTITRRYDKMVEVIAGIAADRAATPPATAEGNTDGDELLRADRSNNSEVERATALKSLVNATG